MNSDFFFLNDYKKIFIINRFKISNIIAYMSIVNFLCKQKRPCNLCEKKISAFCFPSFICELREDRIGKYLKCHLDNHHHPHHLRISSALSMELKAPLGISQNQGEWTPFWCGCINCRASNVSINFLYLIDSYQNCLIREIFEYLVKYIFYANCRSMCVMLDQGM